MLKTALPLAAACLAFTAVGASAQVIWKWRDAHGQVHIGDTAPPPGTPARNVLQRPPGSVAPAVPADDPASSPAPAGDNGLQKKKAQADQEKADQLKAQQQEADQKTAKARAENCQRAQAAIRTIDSGVRIAQTTPQGERGYLDDAGRASELKHAREVASANCH